MTTELTISVAHNDARLAATIAFADTGPNNSRIDFYSADETLLVSVVLAKPCGAISSGVLRLASPNLSGDLIMASGIATHANWVSGSGALVGSGPVSDESGVGPFVLQGTSGTQLYEGGRAILGVTEIV